MPETQPDHTWNQVSSLFEDLIDLPVSERKAYLKNANLPQAALDELLALLAASEDQSYLAKSPLAGSGELCKAVLSEAEAQRKAKTYLTNHDMGRYTL